jgi:hypothetical protein
MAAIISTSMLNASMIPLMGQEKVKKHISDKSIELAEEIASNFTALESGYNDR